MVYLRPQKYITKTKYYYDKELDIYVENATGEVLEYKGKIDRLGYKTYTNELHNFLY